MIRLLESIICRLDTSEISIFKLVSVAEQAGLNIILVGNHEDRFSRYEAHLECDSYQCCSNHDPRLTLNYVLYKNVS